MGPESWRRLTLAEQFGNVGSAIGRAIRWSTKNPKTAQAALCRGLELFDVAPGDAVTAPITMIQHWAPKK